MLRIMMSILKMCSSFNHSLLLYISFVPIFQLFTRNSSFVRPELHFICRLRIVMDKINETTTGIPWHETSAIVFSWYDYLFFFGVLSLSAAIGIYFGCFGNKQSTPVEYLLGGKKMSVIPIAFSIVASAISGVTILAVPADIYRYGATYWLSGISAFIVATVTCVIYLPVFHKLQLTSSYEYLKIRFDAKLRFVASLLFTLNIILYAPIVIYIPAIAFSHVTNTDAHYIIPLVCAVCTFYTTIGGLKAVVWSDALQFSVMLGAMGAIFYLGLVHNNGLENIWKTSLEGGRLNVDLDISPLKRDTLWSVVIGLSFNWIYYIGINQGNVQRFLALPTMYDCRKALAIVAVGMLINKTFTVWTGLMMYTKYHDCDPILSKTIKRPDQLLPYFIMDVASDVPGLPGLFIAGLFCAALSTLSALMNSLAGTIYEDFLSGYMPKDISQKTISNILKLIVVTIGVISTSFVYLVENMGALFPLSISFISVTAGPLVGLFTLGMVFPFANSKGALAGAATSLSLLIWMMTGSQYYKAKGLIRYVPLPTSLDGCEIPMNVTKSITNGSPPANEEDVFVLYRITYYYYTFIGAVVVVVVGLFVSWLCKGDESPVQKDLITPLMQWAIPKPKPPLKNGKEYYSIENALNIVTSNSEKENNVNKQES